VVNSRNVQTFAQLQGMQEQHGSNCGPYPATHFNNSYAGAVFLCNNHVMTAIDAGGYGEIVLTPDHMVDFANGEATIRFNLSTLRTSTRDWVAIWITPFDDNLVLPIDPTIRVDLQGPPKQGLAVRMDEGAGGTIFRAELINNFKGTRLPMNASKSLETLVAPSAIKRTTFELKISRTHLTFGVPDLGYNWVNTPLAGLPFTRALVQLSHHSYNPTKCHPTATLICQPDTWHWSNFYISNAVAFTLLRGDQQVVHDAAPKIGVAATPKLVNFPAPAPQSAFLRFAAVGTIDISLDQGKTWTAAQRQAQLYQVAEHFSSYWMPVPAGTKNVMFRGKPFFAGPWWVRDVAIWSASLSNSPTTKRPTTVPVGKSAAKANHPASLTAILAATILSPPGITISTLVAIVLVGAGYYFVRRRRPPQPGNR
jgi:hypothetical protein